MTPEPHDRAMDARAELEAQILRAESHHRFIMPTDPDDIKRLMAEQDEERDGVTGKPPMFQTYAEKVKVGLGLPPPLERLQDAVGQLWGDADEVKQYGTPEQKVDLRVAVVDLASAVTAIIAHWRAQEIKRLEAEK